MYKSLISVIHILMCIIILDVLTVLDTQYLLQLDTCQDTASNCADVVKAVGCDSARYYCQKTCGFCGK